jgi:hypothetical protein
MGEHAHDLLDFPACFLFPCERLMQLLPQLADQKLLMPSCSLPGPGLFFMEGRFFRGGAFVFCFLSHSGSFVHAGVTVPFYQLIFIPQRRRFARGRTGNLGKRPVCPARRALFRRSFSCDKILSGAISNQKLFLFSLSIGFEMGTTKTEVDDEKKDRFDSCRNFDFFSRFPLICGRPAQLQLCGH